MKYSKIITLKNGMECCLRNATESDGQLVLDNFNLTHTQTDYLVLVYKCGQEKSNNLYY